MPKRLIFDAFTLLICETNVANYALLRCKIFSLKIWQWRILDKYHVCGDLFDETQLDIFANCLMQQNLFYLEKAPLLIIQRSTTWHFLQIIQWSTTYSFITSTEGSGLDGHWPLFWQQRLRQRQKYQINADFLTTRTIGKLGPEQFLANIRRQILGKRDSHSKSRKVIITSV